MKAAGKSSYYSFLFLAACLLFLVPATSAQTAPKVPQFTATQPNNSTITLTIQNQPFDAASYPNDGFFYNVRVRIGEGNWSELYTAEDWYPQMAGAATVLNFTAGQNAYYPRETSQGHPKIPTLGMVEFEVQAMIGHRDRGNLEPGTMIMPYVFMGVTSSWSPPQALTIGPPSPLPPLVSPDQNAPVVWLVAAVLAVALLLAAAAVLRHKNRV